MSMFGSMDALVTPKSPQANAERIERPFAVDRRGTTIQAGDIVLHRGLLRRLASLETDSGRAVLADGAGATTAVHPSELELVIS